MAFNKKKSRLCGFHASMQEKKGEELSYKKQGNNKRDHATVHQKNSS